MHRFAITGIEALSATIDLSGADSLQIAVVYRSPSVAQATLMSAMVHVQDTYHSDHNTVYYSIQL